VRLAVLVDSLELGAHAAPLNDCGGIAATRRRPAVWPAADGLARQSWEANSRTNGYEVAGSADPLTGLCRWLTWPAHDALPLNLSRLGRFALREGLVTLRQTFVRRSQLSLPGRVNDEQWDLFSSEF